MSLYQQYLNYLNQAMPDISGIFSNVQQDQEEDTDQGIVSTVAPAVQEVLRNAGGGEGINLYGANLNDPNISTFKDYQFPFKFTGEDLPEAGDYITPPRTGIMGLYDQYKSLPTGSKAALGGLSLLSGGAIIPAALGVYGLGTTLGGMLPVNRSGIMRNELLGSNFALDNLGRVVAAPGKYDTPEGIMAGYNLTAREIDFDDPNNVFDRRSTNIRNTLKDKYDMTDTQIDSVLQEIEETGEYTGPFGFNETLGKTTNLFSNLFNIGEAKNIVKDRQDRANIITQEKIRKRNEDRDRNRGVDVKKNIDTINKIDFSGMNTGGGGSDPSPTTYQPSGPSSGGLSSIGSGGRTAANRSRTSSRVSGGRTRAYGL